MDENLGIKSSPSTINGYLGKPSIGNPESLFKIPPYQREYTWSTEEWGDFYEDLIDSLQNNRKHFIGTFMFIKRTEGDNIQYQVVDGQQRLTTLSILFLALARIGLENLNHHRWKEIEEAEQIQDYRERTLRNEGTLNYIAGIKSRLLASTLDNIFKSGYVDTSNLLTDKLILKLSLSHCSKNNEDYEKLANDLCQYIFNLDEGKDFKTKCGKKRRIWKAYNYFHNKLSEEVEGKQPKEIYDHILKLAETLASWTTILITTEDEMHAYALFDSLNNRGVPLSPVDIVKNKLFAEMAKYEEREIDAMQEDWVQLLERINSEKLLRRFFVDYYNIYQRDPKKEELLTENRIIDAYSSLIEKFKSKKQVRDFYEDLQNISEIYALIIHPENISPDDFGGGDVGNKLSHLIHLNEISAIPAYGFLTYLYDTLNINSNTRNKVDLFTDVVKMLSKFFAIRHITDTPRVKYLPQLFDRWQQAMKSNIGSATYEDFRQAFITEIKKDVKKFNLESKHLVQEKVELLEYESSKTRTALIRYLFTLYEMNNPDTANTNSKNAAQKLWERNRNTNKREFIYSIEHIIPEGRTIKGESAKYWAEVLGDDIEYAKRSEFMHRLGNLGLLEPNKEAAQKPFEILDSKDVKKGGKNSTYNSKKEYYSTTKYRMFDDCVLKADKWTRTEVEERTKHLAACMTEYLYEDFAELDTKADSE